MIRFTLPLIALAAGGCMQDGRPERPVPGVQCDSNGLDRFVGQMRSPRMEARATRASGAKFVRWLEPGAITTMEFRADRLNLNVDKNGRITSARCG